jgi:hypothetical protein
MVTNCYSCKKEIGFFKPRGTTEDITRAGYKPPEGMLEHDRLCQECLDEIRRTQTQGQKWGKGVNMAVQIILCLVIPIVAFYRIRKTQKFLAYWGIIIGISIAFMIIPTIIAEDDPNSMWFVLGGFMFLYVAGWVIPLVWIINWTKEYNRNSI